MNDSGIIETPTEDEPWIPPSDSLDPETLIELAQKIKKFHQPSDTFYSIRDTGKIENTYDALVFFANNTHQISEEILSYYRAALRQKLLGDKLLGLEVNLEPFTEFHGSGDEGCVEQDGNDELTNIFLVRMVEKYVDFDWYNNDGGGGDITWDVKHDQVIINGFQYIVESESMMNEVAF